jgi:hypothetical protein
MTNQPGPGRTAPSPRPARPSRRAFYPACHLLPEGSPYRDASEWPDLVVVAGELVEVDDIVSTRVPPAEWPAWTDVAFGISTGLPLFDRAGAGGGS